MANHEMEPNLKSIQKNEWQELYILTGHWISDLEFYKEDLGFLRHIINKYIIWITKKENLQRVNEIEVALHKVDQKCGALLMKIEVHRTDLGIFIEHPDKEKATSLITEHGHLEKVMADFVKSFRENRREVFNISSYVIDSEQLSNIVER